MYVYSGAKTRSNGDNHTNSLSSHRTFRARGFKNNKEASCRSFSFSTLFNCYKHGSDSQDYQFNQSKVSIDLSESRKKFVLFELIYNFSSKNVKICCFLNGMICFVIFDSKLCVLDGTEKQFEDITLGSEKQLVYTGGKISRLYFRFNACRIS